MRDDVAVEWIPHPKQQDVLTCPADDIFYGGAAGGGKLLDLDTWIPTPTGWTTVGTIGLGQELFDDKGRVCRVASLSVVDLAPKSYRLTFDDGATVIACFEHLWCTYNAKELAQMTRLSPAWRNERKAKRESKAKGNKSAKFTQMLTERNANREYGYLPQPTGTVRTTQEIVDTLKLPSGRSNHAIPVMPGLELDDVELPIPPYTLGAWLGDGTSASGGFTGEDPEIWQRIESEGFEVTHSKTDMIAHYIKGLKPKLRELGVLGNKHIPQSYLRASFSQRLALLQGLMDTDGHAALDGQSQFDNMCFLLAGDVYELILSLGIKATWVEGEAKLNGIGVGDKWRIQFTTIIPVFHLPRKLTRLPETVRRTTRFRYITKAEEIYPVPMRCLTVDSESHQFLVGRHFIPTHNTALLIFDWALHEQEWGGDAHGLILRRTFPETDEIRNQAFNMLMSLPNAPKWHATDKKFTWKSGADLEIGHLDCREDLTRYIGRPFTWVGKDELTHWPTSYEHDFLMSRMRSTNPNLIPRCISTGNPGGVGHNWVMKRWHIDEFPEGNRPFTETIQVNNVSKHHTRIFFPARLEDNPSLDNSGNYRATLMRMDEKTRKMLLDGRWDVTEGAFFPEWDPKIHVISPREIPRECQRWMGGDWGTAKPYWFGWGALLPWGEVWLYRELYPEQPDNKTNVGTYENAHQVAKKIQAIEAMSDEYVRERYLDYTCFSDGGITESEGGSPLTTASIFTRYNLHFQKSMKSNKKGAIQLLREYLQVTNGQSRLKVFSSCKNLIRVMGSIQTNKNNPEQYDSDGEDHPVDGLLYLLRKNIPLTDEEDERKIRANEHLTKRMNQYKLGRGCR